MEDLDTFLTLLYVMGDDLCKLHQATRQRLIGWYRRHRVVQPHQFVHRLSRSPGNHVCWLCDRLWLLLGQCA